MSEQDKLLHQKSFHTGFSKAAKEMNVENEYNIQVLQQVSEQLETDPRLAAMSKIDCTAKINKANK